MATYCVDGEALTNGTGSEASPFNTLPANFSSSGYLNNDVFLLKRGRVLSPSWSGTDADAFTVNRTIQFGAYGEGPRPIVRATYSGTGNGKLFRFYSAASVFQDIEVRDGTGFHAIYVQNAVAGFTLRNSGFYNLQTDPSNFHNAVTIGPSGAVTGSVVVSGNDFDRIGNDAMVVYASGDVEISHNDIANVSQTAPNGDCIAVVGDVARLRVFGNNCDHTNVDSKQCFIQDGGTGTGYAEIFDNVFNGYFGDGENHTAVYLTLPGRIYRNFIRSNRSGVYCGGANIAVDSNLILQGAGSANIGAIWGTSAGMKARNNTIVRIRGAELSDAAIRNNTSDAANQYKNNLIIGFSRGIRKGALAAESNNAFWQVGTPVIDASAATVTPDATDITADPMLTADYRPLSGSPLIGAGTHLGYVRDLDGKQRPNPPSIGAYDLAKANYR